MRIRPRDVLWMAVGAVVLLLVALPVLFFGQPPSPDARLAAKAQLLDLAGQMQVALVSASEAEKSAVLAVTDQESQAFADQARASTAEVERERRELAGLLDRNGTQREKDLLAEFSTHFAEFQQIDDELLDLAVENSNLKAYALTFGAAADAVNDMCAGLSRVVDSNADSRDAKQVTSLALGAEIAALRIQNLLPPHIAEDSEQRMNELEARMAQEEEKVHGDLEGLRALPRLQGGADLALAASRYAEFLDVKRRILALSRQNTNVRSLSISLNQKRKAMLACHDLLSSLQDAIRKEPVGSATSGGRFGGD